MIYTVKAKETTSGTIKLPASKSISNRQLLINVLSGSRMLPDNLSDSDDTAVMLKALQSDKTHVDVGAAGTSMRFLTAYLSLLPGKHIITGSERMKKRPIGILVDALREIGAEISYAENEGFPPLEINGHELSGGKISLPGNVSSQYISALMMIAPMVKGGLRIELTGKVVSQPYIHMTLQTMAEYGVNGEWNGTSITIPEGRYDERKTTVESDWSASSYWYEIAALTPGKEYKLLGLNQESQQGDAEVKNIAAHLGVETRFEKDGVVISATGKADKHFDYDFNSQPDLAQTFVVLCCLMGVTFRFTGLESLKIKETDRINALINECKKIGYIIKTNDIDELTWDGERCPKSEEAIATYKDHRMAMAFAPASYALEEVKIDDPGVVSKSYPSYWEDLESIGIVIEKEG